MRIRTVRVAIGVVVAAAALTVSSNAVARPQADTARTPHTPTVARAFAAAWNGDDPAVLARLFTADATYVDRAVGGYVHGREGVLEWKTRTDQLIDDLHVTIVEAFRGGNHVAIETIYAGHIKGAPRPFAVHATSVMRLRGDRIVSNTDYYNLSDLLAQSGLPPTWTPPAT